MLGRPYTRVNGGLQPMQAGYRMLDGRQVVANAGDAVAITVAALIGGIVNRTGSTAATADTLPTVTSILAALPEMDRGDSFLFSIRMPDANAITLTVGTGMTAVGTMNVAASNIRHYHAQLTSDNKQTTIQVGSTQTGASAKVLTNFTSAELDNIGIGMAVTGTGVGASAKVVAINRDAGTVTVDVDSTATADNIAMTFTPQMTITTLGTQAI